MNLKSLKTKKANIHLMNIKYKKTSVVFIPGVSRRCLSEDFVHWSSILCNKEKKPQLVIQKTQFRAHEGLASDAHTQAGFSKVGGCYKNHNLPYDISWLLCWAIWKICQEKMAWSASYSNNKRAPKLCDNLVRAFYKLTTMKLLNCRSC